MSDIFISYAKEDRATAQMLARALEATGWTVFWDHDIPPGMTWREYIGQELERTRCMIVVWSKVSVDSRWVLEEAEIGCGRHILIPVRIEDVMPPLGFQSFQAANLTEWDGTPEAPDFKILVAAIEAKLEHAPAVKEEPAASDVGTVRKKEEPQAVIEEKPQETDIAPDETLEKHRETQLETEGEKEPGKPATIWTSLSSKSKALDVLLASISAKIVALVKRWNSLPLKSKILAGILAIIVGVAMLIVLGQKDGEKVVAGAEMVFIPAGEFMMGSPEEEAAKDEETIDEAPQHPVELDAFYIDKYEVTNEEFEKFFLAMGYQTEAEREGSSKVLNDDKGWEDEQGADWRLPRGVGSSISDIMDHPVVHVSWNDAKAYARWAGKRLPTEAEWEYACRAGTTTKYNTGEDSLSQYYANYKVKCDDEDTGACKDVWEFTSPVGSFDANAWGLYDMHGNVWEWCSEPSEEARQPHVIRGGSWNSSADSIRSAHLESRDPGHTDGSMGFRCARDSQMVLIPGGKFTMGAENGENSESPEHEVKFKAFYMDMYEVTNAEYKKFKPAHRFPSDKARYPVIGITWKNADAYAKWAGKRLPTEAEWEYACRAGTTTKYNTGEDSLSHNDANYKDERDDEDTGEKDEWEFTSPVGAFPPNAWGLYDMHGNVWEWCSDWYGLYSKKKAINPTGPAIGWGRVIRGGAWYNTRENLRSANRLNRHPWFGGYGIGFRCVKDIDGIEE